jgi:hypothetical protein
MLPQTAQRREQIGLGAPGAGKARGRARRFLRLRQHRSPGLQGELERQFAFATRRSSRQSVRQPDAVGEMRNRFGIGRALQRPLPGLSPPFDSRFCHARLGELTRQQIWLARRRASELVAQALAGGARPGAGS